MDINKNNFYLFTNYSSYANQIISFPEFLKENKFDISNIDYKEYLQKSKLKNEIVVLFSKYIQRIHTDLEWICDVIDEYKEDMYFHLLHITNVALKINYEAENLNLTDTELLTILITNKFQFTVKSKLDVEMSNKFNEPIPNYGYEVFLDFKTYLLERTSNKAKQKKTIQLSNPDKIAVLYKLGIESTLKNFNVTEDRYRFIHALIGGDYDNIKKVMIAGVSKKNEIAAQEFINSKTI
ncbi:hypothetical protein [Kaistella sp.]|uniref:hypothetical protein n=1 Tax=Kaistella sp. TaxID=2782235 RepID=UPI002F92E0C3